MPGDIIWTDGQDMRLRRLRAEGASWEVIAEQLGLDQVQVKDRASRIGVQPPLPAAAALYDLLRAPLRAGHPDSWGAINRGTALAGEVYPQRMMIR